MIPDREKYVNLEDVKITLHNTDSLGKAAWDVISLPYIEKPKWIPVTERLPEKEGRYLISHQNGKIFIDEWIDGCGWSFFEAITAWMPLPEPYKGDE